ncbi:hypothetical protein TPA0907_48270 [Micromonospora humidisoli]|uniref:Uncharacterized protein n=1 Tax=Micromonospora humidisoli TaxID=2807622 RepID=A0ABS2JB52_9ACTN|nr:MULTISPECIES: hypothetical protein [Micromonospora]MBM7083728.1 hypothetical protein [Micromonospora humidisoli]GHJ10460.1 hypothetical protein TPA0907_48270 [Micromonospora sp. AKA109]
MNTPTRLGGFALVLAVVFGAAYGVGQLTGPGTPPAETRHDPTRPVHRPDPATDPTPTGTGTGGAGHTHG